MKLQVVVAMRDLMSRGMMEAKKAVDHLEGGIKDLVASGLKWVKTGAAVAATGVAIMAAMAGPTMAAANFASGMAEVSTMVDTTVVDMARLKEGTLGIMEEFAQTGQVMTGALYQINSAFQGLTADQQLYVLKQASKAAVGGMTDANTAAKFGLGVINAYGMEIGKLGRVFDVTSRTVQLGVTNFRELSAHVGDVAPVAKQAGVSFEQLMAAYAVTTKKIGNTARATTAIRGLLTALAAPTSIAAQKLKDLGGEAFQAAIKQGNLVGAIAILAPKLKTLGEMRKAIPELEAMSGFAALGGDVEMLKQVADQMKNATGATDEMYKTNANAPNHQMAKLKSSFETLGITIGDVFLPALTSFVTTMTNVVQGIRKWMEEHPRLSSAILKSIGVLGAMLAVVGTGMVLVGGFKLAIAGLRIGIVKLWAVITAHPIGALITALAGLAVGLYYVIKNWESVKSTVSSVFNLLQEKLQKVPDWVLHVIPVLGQVLFVIKHWEKIKTIVSGVFSTVKKWVMEAPDWMLAIIPGIGQVLLAFKHWDRIKQIVADVFNAIPGMFDKFVAWLTNQALSIMRLILAPVNAIRKKLGQEPIKIPVNIDAGDVEKWRQIAADDWKAGVNQLKNDLKQSFGAAREFFSELGGPANNLKDQATGANSAVQDLIDTLKNGGAAKPKIVANWRELAGKLENFGSGMVARAKSAIPSVKVSLSGSGSTSSERIEKETSMVNASWERTQMKERIVDQTGSSRTVTIGPVAIHVKSTDPEQAGREVRKQLETLMEMG